MITTQKTLSECHYRSIYSGVYFALLTKNNLFCGEPTTCKEYILDNFWHYITRCEEHTSFIKPDMDNVRLYVANINGNRAISLINLFENKLGIKESTLFNTQGKNEYVLIGDKDWFISPPMLSLYGLIVRLSQYHHNTKNTLEETIDNMMSDHIFQKAKITICKILEIGYKKIFGEDVFNNWREFARTSSFLYSTKCDRIPIHDAGILSFAERQMIEFYPQWYATLEKTNDRPLQNII